jgi:thioredoxin 1
LSVKSLHNSDFREKLKSCKLAVVDVFADWCGPCQRFAPVFEGTAREYPEIEFFTIDAENAPDFRQSVQIPVLPFVIAFSEGRFVKSESLSTQSALRIFLDSLK